ncbi:MAG: hypothetical protein E6Q98_18240 [Rhodospirillaceae bacterium]|nr:MAG: hypothetical protein E6Q98_18240 [Rhodospirillaceae bacterium]
MTPTLIAAAILGFLSIRSLVLAYRPAWAANAANRLAGTVFGLLGLALVFLAFAGMAMADDGTASTTVINFNEVIMAVLGLAATALATAVHVGGRALAKYLQSKTGIELDNAVRNYLDPAIDKAVAYGQLKVTQAAGDKAEIDIHNETIAHAVNYLLARVPDALEHFGLDAAAVEQMVEARVGSWLGVAVDPTNAAAPVVPISAIASTAAAK